MQSRLKYRERSPMPGHRGSVMKRRSRCWLLMIGVAVLSGCGKSPSTQPEKEPSPAKAPPRPESVIAAWERAGAEVGWMQVGSEGLLEWRPADEKPVKGALQAFRLRVFPTGQLKSLGSLDGPFGLWLQGATLTSVELRELTGLKRLETLYLGGTNLTDADLATLAELKDLRSLHFGGTRVTDGGLKAVGALSQLELLDIAGAKVTDSGLKELARLHRLRALHIGSTRVTDQGLSELTGLKE